MNERLIAWVSKALSENNGSPSCLRVSVWIHDLLIGACLVSLVLASLVFVCLDHSGWVASLIPLFWAILSWFGVNRTSKIVQKGQEQDVPSIPQPPGQ